MADIYPSMQYGGIEKNGVWYALNSTNAPNESLRRYQVRWGSDTVSYFQNFDSYSPAREYVRGTVEPLCNAWQPDAPEQDAIEIKIDDLPTDRNDFQQTAREYSEFIPARCYEFLIFTKRAGAFKVIGFIVDTASVWRETMPPEQYKHFLNRCDSAWIPLDDHPYISNPHISKRLDHVHLGGGQDIRTIRRKVEKMFQNNENVAAELVRRDAVYQQSLRGAQ